MQAEGAARAIGAFSGGLDGIVAAVLLAEQGVEVALATFSSPFFDPDRGREEAVRLGMHWREMDFTNDIMRLLESPPSGFGRRMNPCIDCHAAMFARLGSVMADEHFDFVFTGEVLGQRPMSQGLNSLNRVARLSGLGDRILRPLSARLLPPTAPERRGLIDRERLLAISGRGRREQIEFAKARGLHFPPPSGGCLLTDPGYTARLRVLVSEELLDAGAARLARFGRMIRLGRGAVGFLGRNEAENAVLESLASPADILRLADRPGPSAVIVGGREGVPLLAAAVALYGRVPEGAEARVEKGAGGSVVVRPLPRSVADALLVCSEKPRRT